MAPGAAGPAREFQVTVVWLPITIKTVSDVTAAAIPDVTSVIFHF